MAGVAVGVAAVLGITPTLSATPELAGTTWYLRGTNIGDEPTDAQFRTFMGRVFDGTGTARPENTTEVAYNAGLWPFSRNGFDDLTWNASVQQGVDNLKDKNPGQDDVIFAFSQGAVVASKFKADNPDTGAVYILVENPSRPNGGVMQRFNGLTIPILDITFSGATPDNGDKTIDVARQYSGWSDFPTYPLNLLATVNAIAGIYYLHGRTQRVEDLDAQLAAIDKTNPDYYQEHGNTEYYLIPTDRLPILMPFTGIIPENILDAVDKPLRVIIEAGYDRSDYSKPTGAQLFPKLKPLDLDKDLSDPTATSVAQELKAQSSPGNDVLGAEPTPTVATPTPPKLTLPDVKQSRLELRERISARQAARHAEKDAATSRSRPDRPGAAIRTALTSLTPKAKPKAEPRTEASSAAQD
ncbi:hypothetical protein A5727_12500 [Mycobacterium sp. ACS4331]|nr:hypothetical protein A5727_12500 [Mycobacterium sp. ACS4331]